jgi:hypothetical protein
MNFEFLKNPFVSGIICATIIIILFFIDSKIVKKKKEKKEYIKIFIFVSLTVGILIYIMNIHELFIETIRTSIETPIIKEIKKNLDTGIADF